jgi:hypothetical protein
VRVYLLFILSGIGRVSREKTVFSARSGLKMSAIYNDDHACLMTDTLALVG